MKKIVTLLVAVAFAAGSVIADDKRDAPEKKDGPRDNPERKEGPRDNPEAKKEGPRDNPEANKDGERRDGDKPGANKEGMRRDGDDPGANKEGARRDGDKPGAPVDRQTRQEAKIFVTYDKDKSGTVSEDEMAAMREGRLNSRQKRQIRDEIKKADRNDDGVLDLDEWHVMFSNRRAPDARDGR